MTVTLFVLYALGALFAFAFLASHRPRNWARSEALNAAGWIIVVLIVFVRGLVLIALHGGARAPEGVADAVVSLGSLAAVDALVLFRLASFLRFRRGQR